MEVLNADTLIPNQTDMARNMSKTYYTRRASLPFQGGGKGIWAMLGKSYVNKKTIILSCKEFLKIPLLAMK